MKNVVLIFIFLTFTKAYSQQPNAIGASERVSSYSAILGEDRSYQVFLPASYYFNEETTFPVIYLMDGDYNFHTYTGLIETLSVTAERMPQAIVVGISDKGTPKYRSYCAPTNNTENSGKANLFMDYIEKELKPKINAAYRVADYNILIGHSMGGLFTTTAWLEKPELMDAFIAIDPSYWWNDNEILALAEKKFALKKQLNSKLYFSLANTPGMMVSEFKDILTKHYPESEFWHFNKYPDESHGSVGIPTVKTALEDLFNGYNLSRAAFYELEDANALVDYFADFNEKFNLNTPIPAYFMGNGMYYYNIEKPEQLKVMEDAIIAKSPYSLEEFYNQLARLYIENENLSEARKVLEQNIKTHPHSFYAYDYLASVALQEQNFEEATQLSHKATELVRQVKARQWLINIIQARLEEIKEAQK